MNFVDFVGRLESVNSAKYATTENMLEQVTQRRYLHTENVSDPIIAPTRMFLPFYWSFAICRALETTLI
jgi:hypothetical protein